MLTHLNQDSDLGVFNINVYYLLYPNFEPLIMSMSDLYM